MDRSNRSACPPGLRTEKALASSATTDTCTSKALYIVLGALGAVVAVMVALARMDSTVPALEDRRSKDSVLVKPEILGERRELVERPRPAERADDDEPMFNPAAAEQPDGGE
jgi:hypothetical protein